MDEVELGHGWAGEVSDGFHLPSRERRIDGVWRSAPKGREHTTWRAAWPLYLRYLVATAAGIVVLSKALDLLVG